MMQDPRRLRPSLAGPDMLGVPAAPPAAPPMEFAPLMAPPQQGAAPDISPLTMALQQKMGQSAKPSASTAPRKKMSFDEIMSMMQGGGMYGA